MTYGNGLIPDTALVAISGVSGARLLSGAAAAWESLRAAVHQAHGWYPTPTGPSDTYRSYAVQESIFRARYTTTYLAGRPVKVWGGVRWYLRAGQATAAVPGTSNHGKGIAVDVTGLGGFTGTRYKQLAAIASGLGWSNVEGAAIGEAWHWVYTGPAELTSDPGAGTGSVPSAPSVTAPAPITPIVTEVDDMLMIRYGGVPYSVTPLSVQRASETYATIWRTITGRDIPDVNADGYNAVLAQVGSHVQDAAANLKGQGL